MGPPSPEPLDSLFDVELPPAPYPGLRPFETHEWPIFFGREGMTDHVIKQLVQHNLVVVRGDSGCGKSSLIRAGVLAQLEQEHARSGVSWHTWAMLPRNAPLWNLARALAEIGGREGDDERVRQIRRTLNLGRKAPAALTKLLRRGGMGFPGQAPIAFNLKRAVDRGQRASPCCLARHNHEPT